MNQIPNPFWFSIPFTFLCACVRPLLLYILSVLRYKFNIRYVHITTFCLFVL